MQNKTSILIDSYAHNQVKIFLVKNRINYPSISFFVTRAILEKLENEKVKVQSHVEVEQDYGF